MIVTARMRLVPATVALARAELADQAEFARLLSATVSTRMALRSEFPLCISADCKLGPNSS